MATPLAVAAALPVAALLVSLTSTSARAQSTWQGTTTDYGTNTNWNNNIAPVASGQDAIFSSGGLTTIVVGAPVAPDSWSFTTTSQNYNISGATATLGGLASFSTSGTISIANTILASGTIGQVNAGTLVFTGSGSTAGNLQIAAGQLEIRGGSLTVTNPTLVFGGGLSVTQGGTLTGLSFATIGVGGTAEATVTGPGSTWNVTGGIQVGGGGDGTLTIANGGKVAVDAASQVTVQNGSTVNLGTGGTAGTLDTTFLQNQGAVVANFTDNLSLDAQITGAGSITKRGAGQLTLTSPLNDYTGATRIEGGTLAITNDGSLGNSIVNLIGGTLRGTPVVPTGTINVTQPIVINGIAGIAAAAGSTLSLRGDFDFGASNTVTTFGSPTDTGVVSFDITSGFGNPTTQHFVVAGGTLRDGNGSLGAAVRNIESTTVNSGATLDLSAFFGPSINNLKGSGTVLIGPDLGPGNPTLGLGVNPGGSSVFAGVIDGPGSILAYTNANGAPGRMILSGNNTYTGDTYICDCTELQVGNGGTTGTINGTVYNAGKLLFNRSNTYVFNNTISDDPSLPGRRGQVSQDGTGTTVLTANNTYTGATTVNAGTLSVNGSIVSSSGVTVNPGGMLGGTGQLPGVTVAGGTFAPGNSIGTVTVNGNLVFSPASTYAVEVSPTDADRTNVVGGTATLGGATVNALFGPGTYATRRYTILNATGGVGGTFGSLASSGLPGAFKPSLSYDANNVYLNLALSYGTPGSLSINQQNVANALANSFNTVGLPMVFGTLTPAGLTQVSGEGATGTQQATFDAMNTFLGLLTDPFTDGRGGAAGPMSFSDEDDEPNLSAFSRLGQSLDAGREAFARMPRKGPAAAPVPQRRWNVWAAGFGGSQTTSGNAVTGSNTATSQVYGGAVGFDYRLTPYTIAGFALAGGGTSFSVSGLGSGSSDLFQAGAYVRHAMGPAYITAALAYGWQDVTTKRTVTVAGVEQLQARFNAHALAGRVESGYRFATPWMGVTPYAAGQVTTYYLPGYAETAVWGSNTFALNYASKDVTASRSELGLRADRSFAMPGALLTLRGRAAWAHNFDTERSIQPTFQALPASSFVVNGAALARNSALTTASAEWKWASNWSVAGTFEGEFSNVTRSYAGKGVVRYQW